MSGQRNAPLTPTGENGSEVASQAQAGRAGRLEVRLDIIHPGKPVEQSSIEAFTDRLRHEGLNGAPCLAPEDARRQLEAQDSSMLVEAPT